MALGRLRAWLATGPNRIALASAWRGTIATVVPLVALPLLGAGTSADFAVIGALGASMVDAGGPYRNRLAALGAETVLGPCLLLLGMVTGHHWWLAMSVMALIAWSSGLVRTFGPVGVSLGLNLSVAFLIGLEFPTVGLTQGLEWAAGFAAGAFWTILVTLGFWQLRPYRRLEQETASAWEAVIVLAAGARRARGGTAPVSQEHETMLARQRLVARAAIEQGRAALGEARAGTHGQGTTLAALLVLLQAAARIDAAIVALDETESQAGAGDSVSAAALAEAMAALEEACRRIVGIVRAGKGTLDLVPVRRCLARLTALDAERRRDTAATAPALDAEVTAYAQAMRHFDNADEALRQIQARRRPFQPQLASLAGLGWRGGVAALRAQFTPKSIIFRHALRGALVAGVATAAIVKLQMPHGIWLPMTALVILQPDYGGTLNRALQRTAGTVGGAVLAGVLLSTLHGTATFQAAIALLLFATFLLLRRRYGLAMGFLTPLIILLLGLEGPDPWTDLVERVVDTLAGAALAVVTGYFLWPIWERARLPDQLARAVRASRLYLLAVLEGLGGAAMTADRLAALRRAAEVEAVNLDASFQRMLTEPRHQRRNVGRGFAFNTYVQRLTRHTLALSSQLGTVAVPPEAARALAAPIEAVLEGLTVALAGALPPPDRPDFDTPLGRLRQALSDGQAGAAAVAFRLGQLVSDITGLLAAAPLPAAMAEPAAPDAV